MVVVVGGAVVVVVVVGGAVVVVVVVGGVVVVSLVVVGVVVVVVRFWRHCVGTVRESWRSPCEIRARRRRSTERGRLAYAVWALVSACSARAQSPALVASATSWSADSNPDALLAGMRFAPEPPQATRPAAPAPSARASSRRQREPTHRH